MVHEIEGVPEELYNLTQLAEVSLAAGKLPPVYETKQENVCTYQVNHNGWTDKKCEVIDSRREQDNTDYDKVLNYSTNTSTKKKWKHEWEESCYQSVKIPENTYPAASMFHTLSSSCHGNMNNHASTLTTSYQHHLSNYDSPYGMERRPFCSNSLTTDLTSMSNNSNINNNDTSRRNSLVSTSSSLASSSSDDDSSLFSYSHKVFDRKKIRRNIENYVSCVSSGADNTNSMTNSAESDQGSVESGAEEIHTCPECGKKYSTSSNLARHRQTHRSLQDKKARRCPQCDKVYVSMPAFAMHVRTHSQGCQCKFCGKTFSRPWLLQGHIRTHTGEKPFKCESCGKSFADKSNLRAHVQTHSNVKPYECGRCLKKFALKSYLYKHEESSCMRNHIKNGGQDKPQSRRKLKSSSITEKDNINGITTTNKKESHAKATTMTKLVSVTPKPHEKQPDDMTAHAISVTKSLVKTRIREVLEENSRKSAAALANFQQNASKVTKIINNRISVIRTVNSYSQEMEQCQEPLNFVTKPPNFYKENLETL